LVIAGRKGWLVDDLFTAHKRSAAAERIVFTGYLSDEELGALYSSCAVFIYPSIYEGFGLPPLEAMACGAPVIASDISSIKEVVGKAARLVSPSSKDELARAINELLDSEYLRRDLSTRGVKRAAEFCWSESAAATREVYAEAIERFGEAG
jgi:glycosyltransferase involved in cell wall biosynthesis